MTILDKLLNKFNLNMNQLKTGVSNRKPYFGISYRNLRSFSKELSKDNYQRHIETNTLDVYELEIIQTYLIGDIKNFNLALEYFKSFAPKAREWSVVDSLCQKFVIAKKYQKEVFNVIKTYSHVNDEYLQRISAVLILSHFLNDEYVDQSINILDQLKFDGYFTKMAVAWAFTSIMSKYPDKCISYLKQNRLDDWTHNKAIFKMKDSFQISDEYKQILLTMKR